jgi:hypothetical protein
MSDMQEQIDVATRLQVKWLKRMETMIDEGTITSTDMATLARFLLANGWTLDPSRLPQGLRDKLTKHVKFDADEDGEDQIRHLKLG